MQKKTLILLLVNFSYLINLFSQTPSYYQYTSSDGLASSTVYDIIQDEDGYMWFATANGISKFDGKRFTTFRTEDGLNSNSIISMVNGEHGELYFGNFEKGINVFRNGKIKNYCNKINGKSFLVSYLTLGTYEKGEQKIFAYSRWGDIKLIREKYHSKITANVINAYPVFINKLEILPNGKILALTTTGLYYLQDGSFSKLYIKGLPDIDIYCLTKGEGGSYFIGTKEMIFKIEDYKVTEKYPINIAGNNEVVSILKDKNKNIWFSIMNLGFYMIPNGSNKIVDIGEKMDLQKTLVNKYFEDNEGNIWISTLGKGVYCINNLYLKNFSEKDGLSSNNVYSIVNEKSGKLLIGTFTGVNILENWKINQIRENEEYSLDKYIYSIKNIDDEIFICSAFGENEIINFSYGGLKLHMFDGLSFCKLKNGLFLVGTRANSIRVQREFNLKKQSYIFKVFGDSTRANRINEIFEDSEKNVWVGTGHGLCKVTNMSEDTTNWKKSFFPTNHVLNSRINSISQDNENNVWFAGEKGIAKYNLKNDSISSYINIMENDLSSSTSIVADKKDRIWIGNMKGLYLFDMGSVKHLNMQTGLPSNEIYSLSFEREKNILYVGTSNGISVLDVNYFDNSLPPALTLKIISIKAGDSLYTNYDNLVFKPEQEHVYIAFKALSFSSPGSVKYKYKLNDVWIETDNDLIDLLSLKHGKYALQIMAKSQNTEWSKPYFLSFKVLPRFVETIWFIIIIVFLFIALSVILILWRLKLENKKNHEALELSERINELKHQALSAMMNPHFIFNSLNSVQYLINCNRNEEANDYIAIMAKLIRKNLDTAGNGFILLSDEINRLKLYLNLEKLRFQDKFSFEVITATDVLTETIMIPNMIIQPFVENSLWHGIINSGEVGLLTVSFSFEDVDIDSVICKSLIIKVTDNGIGIIEAKKHKQDDHISKGIQIIEERLRLLSTKMQIPQPIMFEDLSSLNEKSHGTEVIISLPLPLYKIIKP